MFADDGALWKRWRNVQYIVKKIQEGINRVEMWGMEWGFKFSAEKSKVMVFSVKKNKDIKLRLYRNNLERVEFSFFWGYGLIHE